MYNTILENLRENIEELPFIERHGGLIKIVPLMVETPEGMTSINIPVTCDENLDDCFTDLGEYTGFFVSEDYKGMSAFEARKPFRRVASEMKGLLKFEGSARLIVFLNLQKLGVDACSIDGIISINIINALDGTYKNLENPFEQGTLKVTVSEIQPSNPERIFEDYEMPNQMLLHPFEFLVFDIDLEFQIGKGCISIFQPSEPIPC